MHVIVHFGFPGNTASDFLFILCLLYAGESESISEAKNRGLQTQQCQVLAVEGLTPKERRPELQREQRRRRPLR